MVDIAYVVVAFVSAIVALAAAVAIFSSDGSTKDKSNSKLLHEDVVINTTVTSTSSSKPKKKNKTKKSNSSLKLNKINLEHIENVSGVDEINDSAPILEESKKVATVIFKEEKGKAEGKKNTNVSQNIKPQAAKFPVEVKNKSVVDAPSNDSKSSVPSDNKETDPIFVAPTLNEESTQNLDQWVEIKTKVKKSTSGNFHVTDPIATPKPTIDPVEQRSTDIKTIYEAVEELRVQSNKIGVIVGIKGARKIAIQTATSTVLTFPPSDLNKSESAIITISGTNDGVKKAKSAINDILTKGYSTLLEGPDFRETSISIHPNFVHIVIGKSGANIKAIQDKLGVKINTPSSSNNSSSVKVIVGGLKESVIRAKALIKELIQFYHTDITHPGQVHVEMDIPPSSYNHIIGQKGSEIKHIQASYKVEVHIPNDDSINRNVLIVGLPSNVERAQKHIISHLEKIASGVRTAKEAEKLKLEEDKVDIVDENLEIRAHEVEFDALLSTAKHSKGSTLKDKNNAIGNPIKDQSSEDYPHLNSSKIPEKSEKKTETAWSGSAIITAAATFSNIDNIDTEDDLMILTDHRDRESVNTNDGWESLT